MIVKTENVDVWPDGERPITFDDDGNTTIWWWLLAFPVVMAFCMFHFMLCVTLTVFVHPESKRYKFYEYYSPWGWGKRNV